MSLAVSSQPVLASSFNSGKKHLPKNITSGGIFDLVPNIIKIIWNLSLEFKMISIKQF